MIGIMCTRRDRYGKSWVVSFRGHFRRCVFRTVSVSSTTMSSGRAKHHPSKCHTDQCGILARPLVPPRQTPCTPSMTIQAIRLPHPLARSLASGSLTWHDLSQDGTFPKSPFSSPVVQLNAATLHGAARDSAEFRFGRGGNTHENATSGVPCTYASDNQRYNSHLPRVSGLCQVMWLGHRTIPCHRGVMKRGALNISCWP